MKGGQNRGICGEEGRIELGLEQHATRKRRISQKCMKCIALSLSMTFVVLSMSGCAALLFVDNRKAYRLMVKAADYFIYPESVQIESGMMSSDDEALFCVIRARNRGGFLTTDTYFIGKEGYPSEYYTKLCYSDKLNCDLINTALAMHFSSPIRRISNSMTGGVGMELVLYIALIALMIWLNWYLSKQAVLILGMKGHFDDRKWFWMCFFLGVFAYILVAAMPDLVEREEMKTTNKLLKAIAVKEGAIYGEE